MAIDIGVAIVEHPYNFTDVTWQRHCSYIPKPIRISYDEQLQVVDADVVAFGWGGSHWRTVCIDILDNVDRPIELCLSQTYVIRRAGILQLTFLTLSVLLGSLTN